jgi:diguanylate cyclase (GGDEF)-like protein
MISAPATIAIDPLKVTAFGAAAFCVLLLLQYAHRRHPFILVWAASWLLVASSALIVDRVYTNVMLGRAATGVAQCLTACASTLVFWSADLFRHTRYAERVPWKVAVGVAAFVIVAPQFGATPLLVPGSVLTAGILAASAAMYSAVLIERRMIGAGLIAFVLAGIAMTSVATAVFLPKTAAADATFQILAVNAVLSMLGAVGVHLLVFEEMTYELRVANRQLESAQEELVQAAITDALTGCHNRRFFDQIRDRELQRHARFTLPLSLLFVDVDRFKAINDTMGHDVGDKVLQFVAKFLKRRIREADYVFRWGGDEFLVLITCAGDEARRKAAALKKAFDADPDVADLPPGVGLSVGWVEVPPGTRDLTAILTEADRRMYKDKAAR